MLDALWTNQGGAERTVAFVSRVLEDVKGLLDKFKG